MAYDRLKKIMLYSVSLTSEETPALFDGGLIYALNCFSGITSLQALSKNSRNVVIRLNVYRGFMPEILIWPA